MPSGRKYAAVAFDETAWSEDMRNATNSAREIATRRREQLERNGQAIDELRACDSEGSDGTRLPGCVKVYIPPPSGAWGLVYLIARDRDARLSLDHLAFGLRRPPRGRRASVYQIAHERLNNKTRAKPRRARRNRPRRRGGRPAR
jgi:hypothetical protein